MSNLVHRVNKDCPSCQVVAPTRPIPSLQEDVYKNLLIPPRRLPAKYFYDEIGSQLFAGICNTSEYYLTRTEDALLRQYSQCIISTCQPHQILEFGSGNSQKTRRLLNACAELNHTCEYAPFDVCEPVLKEAAEQLLIEYPWLSVSPLLGDYQGGLNNLPIVDGVRLFLFLGSTIGNFSPEEVTQFFVDIRHCMKPGDYLLLAVDRGDKLIDILHAAYNDSAGLTAQFNLNLLNILNRELAANFYLPAFQHQAKFISDFSRVEMRLVTKFKQVVNLGKLFSKLTLEAGEYILTETCYKYTKKMLNHLLLDSKMQLLQHFTADNDYYSLLLLKY